MSGWIGVDLDGTLAEYHGWNNGAVGAPVPAMVARVKAWLQQGQEVRIFTARVGWGGGWSEYSQRSDDDQFIREQRAIIMAWCREHIGAVLPITAVKDFRMAELWDDRAVQVIPNTGIRVDGVAA